MTSAATIKRRIYRLTHPEIIRRNAKKSRARRVEKIRAYHRVWQKKRWQECKAVLGRACRSCKRGDHETGWTFEEDLCGACRRRGQQNGYCETCGFALYRGGQGSRPRPCRCPSEIETSLWDAIRWVDASEVLTRDRLAELMRCCKRQVERRKDAILEIARRYDPEARWEASERLGGPLVLVARIGVVRAGLEKLVIGSVA